jgi:putative heme-binding domain-containing protein
MTLTRLRTFPSAGFRLSTGCIGTFLTCIRLYGADPFAENVRPTDPLTPDQEQKAFHLPPGFEIQLVAAEPDINKPMNLAFDAHGRLWVTTSRDYPFPAPLDQPGRDRVVIFEDFGADGRARKVTTFAEGLTIPTGLYPFRSPSTLPPFNGSTNAPVKGSRAEGLKGETWKCIVWSIPNIWLLEDTDGDGKADKKERLYGPFGWERDTHGMNSSFTRGFDGRIYATHGYNNNTDVRGRDGNEVKMNSGNTYRFTLDGARIEQNSWGQVNPFGLCFDALGNLYSADCHSEPVYQLLHGGYYPSFGKPNDGLGFAPSMIFHGHGSTAISGIVYYEDNLWPEEYRDNIFTGNVMTSRVNRDAVRFTGSTPLANERPDFVSTEDPWFRPVNLQLGPDGALYMADFYNRIIGHYEVPLTHPGRDRTSGRIWRIVYKGGSPKSEIRNPKLPEDLDGLIAQLGSPNLTRRMLAMNEICDRFPKEAPSRIKRAGLRAPGDYVPADPAGSPRAWSQAHSLWSLERLGALDDRSLKDALEFPSAIGRVHALRILTERGLQAASHPNIKAAGNGLKPALRKSVLAALNGTDALVQRCAAEALGAWPSFENIRPLLGLKSRVPDADTHLLYVVRKALRDQLKADGVLARLTRDSLSEGDARAIADVAVAVPTAEAGEFLLRYVRRYSESKETLANYLRHASRYAPEKEMDSLAAFTRAKFAEDLDFQLALFKSIQQGAEQRAATPGGGVRDWGAELARQLLDSANIAALGWGSAPVEGMANTANPWFVQQRASADGDKSSWFLCSLPPGGESLTGVLRSTPFSIPPKLHFFLAGHDGSPDKPAQKKNVVRLRLLPDNGTPSRSGSETAGAAGVVAAETAALPGEAIAETSPPRNDTAQPVAWDLTQYAAKQGYLEVVDGDNGGAYAWLAIGRFDPPVVNVPKTSPNVIGQRLQAAAELARTLSLANMETRLAQILVNPATEPAVGAAIAQTLVTLDSLDAFAALAPLVGDHLVPATLRQQIARAIAGKKSSDAGAVLDDAFRVLTRRFQIRLAESLAGSASGAEQLLKRVADGHAPAAVLLERPVKDKLQSSKPANLNERLAQLTKGVSAPAGEIQKLIDQRRANFDPKKASAARGEKIFTLNCRPCHQIDSAGNVVGPQLDGVGGRGLERLLEDVLDPNRNVDPAFHSTIVALRDGNVESGLFRREEGEAIVLANSAGKEISIPKKDIVERRASTTSLMPENFGEIILAADFDDLMAFLLEHGPKPDK